MTFQRGDRHHTKRNKWANKTPEEHAAMVQETQRKQRERWMTAMGPGLFTNTPILRWLGQQIEGRP